LGARARLWPRLFLFPVSRSSFRAKPRNPSTSSGQALLFACSASLPANSRSLDCANDSHSRIICSARDDRSLVEVKRSAGSAVPPKAAQGWAPYTVLPPTIVHRTLVSRASSAVTVRTSRSSRVKSACFPAAMDPILLSSLNALAALMVYP
jgi:hypothetical protein